MRLEVGKRVYNYARGFGYGGVFWLLGGCGEIFVALRRLYSEVALLGYMCSIAVKMCV